jgi:class 3 adenylate cyclase
MPPITHAQLRKLNEKLAQLTEQNRILEDRYRRLIEAGNATFALKSAIDDELNTIAERLGASASSIIVPAPSTIPDDKPDSLVFLTLLPEKPELQGERVSLDSVAGHVLQNRKSLITQNPIAAGGFSKSTDQVANFKTDTMLVIPLFHKASCVGVAEFLNKRSGSYFDDSDQSLAENLVGALGYKVGNFTSDAGNLNRLGITPRQKATEATILVSDISNSSELARNLDPSVVIDLMNQYFEALCDIGLRYGGTVDQFLGDGFMMTFNVKRSLADHPIAAIKSACEMQKRFDALKSKWATLKYPGVALVHNRIGLTTGPVQKAELGHSQFRQITVMGDAVNMATHLCQAGNRDRNVIVVSDNFYARLPRTVSAVPMPVSKGKAIEIKALELTGADALL